MSTFREEHTEIAQTLQTVRDFIRWGASRFAEAELYFGHGTDNGWDDALQLVMFALHLPGFENPAILDAKLLMSERLAILELFDERVEERVPAAYITGSAVYCGLRFIVNEHVLVPRSPIAELIENQFAPWLSLDPETILDLCTGSGCIGIACAYAFPNAQVDLSDISSDALAVARENIAEHGLEDRVVAWESDLFEDLPRNRYDLIVSNPPYVDADDLASMPEEFHAEPSIALGSGEDGLDFTRRLLSEARDWLTEDGLLVVEVGNSWSALEDAYPNVPFTWMEFARGGHGVFVLTAAQLDEFAEDFEL